jgi:hypothetical protein
MDGGSADAIDALPDRSYTIYVPSLRPGGDLRER